MFSASHTGRYLYPFLTWLFGPLDPVRYAYWHGLARKAGHVVGYGILCWLYFRAWRATLTQGEASEYGSPRSYHPWSLKWAALALLFTAIVASMDEWHQSYIPSRTGTWHDVLLDSTAALVVLILIRLWIRRRTRQPERMATE